jgi:hypothetical protein
MPAIVLSFKGYLSFAIYELFISSFQVASFAELSRIIV